MPKSSRGGRRNTPTTTTSSNTNATPVAAPMIMGPAVPLTDQDVDDLRDSQDSMYNGNVAAAIKMYITGEKAPMDNVDGQGHSLSQVMNYLNEQGEDISTADLATINKKYGINLQPRYFSSIQFMDSYMDAGMHAIGKDTTLYRGAHDDVLKNEFGISDYSKLSESQLKAKLVGASWTNKAVISTGYTLKGNPFLDPSSPVSGGREIVYNIKAPANTRVLIGRKSQKEIIIGKNTNYRITDVRYTKRIATPKGGVSRQAIEIDVEIY